MPRDRSTRGTVKGSACGSPADDDRGPGLTGTRNI